MMVPNPKMMAVFIRFGFVEDSLVLEGNRGVLLFIATMAGGGFCEGLFTRKYEKGAMCSVKIR